MAHDHAYLPHRVTCRLDADLLARLDTALDAAGEADDELLRSEDEFWASDPLMEEAQDWDAMVAEDDFMWQNAEDIAEAVGVGLVRPQDALSIAPGVAGRLLRLRVVRPVVIRARSREHRARPSRRVRTRSGSRGDPPDDPDEPDDVEPAPGQSTGRFDVDREAA